MARKDSVNHARSVMVVSKSKILGNLTTIKNKISDNIVFLAVVKGNAWGLGTVPYAQTLVEGGIGWIGTSAIEDALELRNADIQIPILLLTEIPLGAVDVAIKRHLHFTICTRRFVAHLAKRAAQLDMVPKVHLKINTGLNRIGVLPSEVQDMVGYLATFSNIEIHGAFTHFSYSNSSEDNVLQKQLSNFLEASKTISPPKGSSRLLLHAANTAATIDVPQTHLDMVRVGMGLAGLYPEKSLRQKIKLKFPMRWMSQVTFVRIVPKGTRVGYNGQYLCTSNATIATMPIGYTDGLRKCFETNGFVLIHGHRCRIVVVMMDQSLIHLNPEIAGLTRCGDDIVLLGQQGNAFLDPEEVAGQVGLHTEEMVCGLNPRIERVYKK